MSGVVQPLEEINSWILERHGYFRNSPVAPAPALKVVGLDPGPDTDFALRNFDTLILAFLVFATSPIVRGNLCRASQLSEIIIVYLTR